MNVVCQSSRGGVKPDLIVIHDTESHDTMKSNLDLTGIGNFFNRVSTQASSHVCVDGEGRSARYVLDDAKAWHCMNFNSRSLGIEQIGFATFTQLMWNKNRRAQAKKVAQYIAYWSKKYGIPIQEGKVSSTGIVLKSGVVTHASLGVMGGGHHDPGPNYPFSALLRTAKWYKKYGWY